MNVKEGDRILECRECGLPFNWPTGSQLFFAKHKLGQPPYCNPCRESHKEKRIAAGLLSARAQTLRKRSDGTSHSTSIS